MANLISFPFKLAVDGTVVTRPDGSDQYYAEELAVLLMTRPGERVLVPTYGMNDPVFSSIDVGQLRSQVSKFGPPVKVASVAVSQVSADKQEVQVSFDSAGNPNSVYGVPDDFTVSSQQPTFVNTGQVNQ